MWRKLWYAILVIVLVVSMYFWLSAELDIKESNFVNKAWTTLAAEKAETADGYLVLVFKRILTSDLKPEEKFADLMVMSKAYPETEIDNINDYYQLYWLAVSDTKTGNNKVDEVVEATRRLLFVDSDIDQRLTDISIIVGYNVDSERISSFGSRFDYYIDNRSTVKSVLLEGLDYKTLLVPVNMTREYLWIIPLMAFLGLMYMLILSGVPKKKMTNNQEVGK